jgi:hypothetical protein
MLARLCLDFKGGIPEKLYEDINEFPYNYKDGLARWWKSTIMTLPASL